MRCSRRSSGLGVALIFEKPSNRTRQSMEMAVVQLGGHPVYTRGEEVGFDVREPVEDIARIMEGYHALIAARVFDHTVVERLAAAASVPVVNMLSDRSHPLQGLADVLTMQQCLGDLAGRTVAYVGDYNNVARSLAEASAMLGMHVRLGCPTGFDADAAELERILLLGARVGRAVAAAERGRRRRPRRAHRHVGVDGAGGRQGGAPPGVRGVHRRRFDDGARRPGGRLHALPARPTGASR